MGSGVLCPHCSAHHRASDLDYGRPWGVSRCQGAETAGVLFNDMFVLRRPICSVIPLCALVEMARGRRLFWSKVLKAFLFDA